MLAWLDGELPPERAREMTAHVRGCADCAACMRQSAALYDALEALPGPGPDPELLRDTLRAVAEEQASPVRWWLGLPALHKSAGFAAVAMGLLLGIVLYNASSFAPETVRGPLFPTASSVLIDANSLEYL